MTNELPPDCEMARRTPTFDEATVPRALLSAHRVAEGVWGRLMVEAGRVGFVFEDEPDQTIDVGPGSHQVIPPARPHRVVVAGPASFHVEFYKPRGDGDGATPGST